MTEHDDERDEREACELQGTPASDSATAGADEDFSGISPRISRVRAFLVAVSIVLLFVCVLATVYVTLSRGLDRLATEAARAIGQGEDSTDQHGAPNKNASKAKPTPPAVPGL